MLVLVASFFVVFVQQKQQKQTTQKNTKKHKTLPIKNCMPNCSLFILHNMFSIFDKFKKNKKKKKKKTETSFPHQQTTTTTITITHAKQRSVDSNRITMASDLRPSCVIADCSDKRNPASTPFFCVLCVFFACFVCRRNEITITTTNNTLTSQQLPQCFSQHHHMTRSRALEQRNPSFCLCCCCCCCCDCNLVAQHNPTRLLQ